MFNPAAALSYKPDETRWVPAGDMAAADATRDSQSQVGAEPLPTDDRAQAPSTPPMAAALAPSMPVSLPVPTRLLTATAAARLTRWSTQLSRAAQDPSEIEISGANMRQLLAVVRTHRYPLRDVLTWLNNGESMALREDYRPHRTNAAASQAPLRPYTPSPMPEVVMLPEACEILYQYMWQHRMFSLARTTTALMGEDLATQYLFSRPAAKHAPVLPPMPPTARTWACIKAETASGTQQVQVFKQQAPGYATRFFVVAKAGDAPNQAQTYAFDVRGVDVAQDNPGEQHMYFRTLAGVLYYGSSLQDDELQRQQEAPWRYRCTWQAYFRPVDAPSIALQVRQAYSAYVEPAH